MPRSDAKHAYSYIFCKCRPHVPFRGKAYAAHVKRNDVKANTSQHALVKSYQLCLCGSQSSVLPVNPAQDQLMKFYQEHKDCPKGQKVTSMRVRRFFAELEAKNYAERRTHKELVALRQAEQNVDLDAETESESEEEMTEEENVVAFDELQVVLENDEETDTATANLERQMMNDENEKRREGDWTDLMEELTMKDSDGVTSVVNVPVRESDLTAPERDTMEEFLVSVFGSPVEEPSAPVVTAEASEPLVTVVEVSEPVVTAVEVSEPVVTVVEASEPVVTTMSVLATEPVASVSGLREAPSQSTEIVCLKDRVARERRWRQVLLSDQAKLQAKLERMLEKEGEMLLRERKAREAEESAESARRVYEVKMAEAEREKAMYERRNRAVDEADARLQERRREVAKMEGEIEKKREETEKAAVELNEKEAKLMKFGKELVADKNAFVEKRRRFVAERKKFEEENRLFEEERRTFAEEKKAEKELGAVLHIPIQNDRIIADPVLVRDVKKELPDFECFSRSHDTNCGHVNIQYSGVLRDLGWTNRWKGRLPLFSSKKRAAEEFFDDDDDDDFVLKKRKK